MKGQGLGSIVNISWIYGVVENDFTIYEGYGETSPATYSAIKGGIINFSRYLASYFGKHGIRVNCVSPEGIKDQHLSFIECYESKPPLKRMGRPEKIALVIRFLSSDVASFITGHTPQPLHQIVLHAIGPFLSGILQRIFSDKKAIIENEIGSML